MPVRMVEDENQQPQRPTQPRNSKGGGRGMGMLGALLPVLFKFVFKKPKIAIPIILIGGFFLWKTMGTDGTKNLVTNIAGLSKGATLDPHEFDKAEVFEPLANNDKNPLPNKISLLKYAPSRKNQGSQGSCVAWSSAYAARTILEARRRGTSGNRTAFSPAFMYNQIKLPGCQGSYINRAMEHMKTKGGVMYNQFPYDERSCSKEPGYNLKAQATKYRTLGYNRLTVSARNQKIDLNAIRQNLAQGAPVVMGMMVGGSFMQAMQGKKVWIPNRNDYTARGFGGHAMCVIGYDDYLKGGAFQIMNSWGPEWGENGIAWVRYNDFNHFVKEAYGLYPMGSTETQSSTLRLAFGLVTDKGMNIPLRSVNKITATAGKLPIGTKFKIEVTNNRACYIYVFGEEVNSSTYTLFPYTSKHSPFCGIVGTRIFPRDHSMILDSKGNKDKIAVVVSTEPIDYKGFAGIMTKQNGSFEQKLKKVIGSNLSKRAQIGVSQNVVKLQSPVVKGEVYAQIIEINK